MKSAFDINILRSIKDSLGRFVAIAGIVALGCGFYAGLRMTAPDMDMTADAYYDQTDLMDIRVVSTLGLTDADLQAIRAVPGVQAVEGGYETDVMVTLNDEQYAMRVHSLPYAALTSGSGDEGATIASEAEQDALNKLTLVEGEWPAAPDECVISADNVMNAPVALGDVIQVDEGVQDLDDTLTERSYRIVGFAHSPYYVSTTAMGSTSLGSGAIDQFMYVPVNDFAADLPYTEAFIQVSGAKAKLSGSAAYQDCIDEVMKELHGIEGEREAARLAEVRADAQEELDERRADYERERADAEAQLADARLQLDEAAATLERSRQKLARGQADYEAGKTELVRQRESAEAQMAEGQTQIDAQRSVLEASEEELVQAKAQLDAGWQQAAALPSVIPGLPPVTPDTIDAAISFLEAAIAVHPSDDLKQALSSLQKLKENQTAYDAGQAAYEAGSAQITAAQRQLDEQRSQAADRFTQAQAQLDSAAAELESGRAQLANGEADYEAGFAEYQEEYAKAQDEFARAEQRLADAQADIDAIEEPEWLIMDRTKNPGVVSFASDADRVDSIASFFPFIFFLVAALVALTTMTRMVEEERMLIGTFKALGYSRARITSKYLIYAALAAGLGSVLGIAVLSQVLPWVIMEAYSIVYYVPRAAMPIDWPIALAAAGLGIGITLLATWAAAAATLRETPAALMQPPAPKAGKRILLERVGPLWRRLSFSWKVTFRNIFRYKRRLVMTCVGIAGCTALLLTGLGLQNSINDIIDVQYGELVDYNVVISEKDDAADDEREAAAALLGDAEKLPVAVRATETSMIAQGVDGTEAMTTIVAPSDPEAFKELWHFRTREGHDEVGLTDAGAIVTEKLATKLGLSVGDAIVFAEQDDLGNATATTYSVPVTGIIENYIGDFAFMTPETYARTFGEEPDNLTVYARATTDEGERSALSEALRATRAVDTVAFNDEVIDSYKQMLRSVNMVVVVLVAAAAALAFIVLYNLTNINITERAREIATLKVLGFTPREVNAYIFREIVLLAMLGALVGLGLGVVLEGFVVVTAEVDQVMFGRTIHWDSFVIAFVLTMVFTAVVMLVMRPKLAHIDMVESLKSNE